MIKKRSGLTLISLVVMIVVLLILAAVSINMLFGESGVLTNASKSSFRYEMSELQEKVSFHCANVLMKDKGRNKEIDRTGILSFFVDDQELLKKYENVLGVKDGKLAIRDVENAGDLKEDFEEIGVYEDWVYMSATFASPYWTSRNPYLYLYTEDVIEEIAYKMKELKITHQFVDVGFYDRTSWDEVMDGTYDASMDKDFYQNLGSFINVFKRVAPEIKLIASVNGSTYLHVLGQTWNHRGNTYVPAISKEELHSNIVKNCEYLINTYDFDGINLNFEPIFDSAVDDYVGLANKVRQVIGKNKELSACTVYDLDGTSIAKFSNALDLMIVMGYDTAKSNRNDYINYITNGIVRYSRANANLQCRVLALGPGKYTGDPDYHTSVETSENHFIAVHNAIKKSARISGSGVWWFEGIRNDTNEINAFKQQWLKEDDT